MIIDTINPISRVLITEPVSSRSTFRLSRVRNSKVLQHRQPPAFWLLRFYSRSIKEFWEIIVVLCRSKLNGAAEKNIAAYSCFWPQNQSNSYFDLRQKHEKTSPQNEFSHLVLTGTIISGFSHEEHKSRLKTWHLKLLKFFFTQIPDFRFQISDPRSIPITVSMRPSEKKSENTADWCFETSVWSEPTPMWSNQGGIKGEGAVPTQDPTQAFLTRLSLNSQLPEHTQHYRCRYTDQLWLHATKQPRTVRPRPLASSVRHIPAVLLIDEFCLRLPFAILLVPTSVSFSRPN